MVWGCMGLYGEEWVGKLVKVEGKIDAKQFYEILKDSWMESFETLGIEEGEYYVQQDNNSKHTSKRSKSGLKTMVFKTYSSQPNSLTSIQLNSFGKYFKCQLYQYETPLERVHELWNQVGEK